MYEDGIWMHETVEEDLSPYTSDYKFLKDFWFEKNNHMKTWITGDVPHTQINEENLWNMQIAYEENARIVVGLPGETYKSPDNLPEWRFIHDNRKTLSDRYVEGTKGVLICLPI